MFLTIQYPIIDFRRLIEMNYRLSSPMWPNADVKNYVRYFGKVERRKKGGVHQWPSERLFCGSWHALNLNQLTTQRIIYNSTVHSLFSCKFRRFFSNGTYTNKIELGFTTDLEKLILNNKIKKGQENFEDLFNKTIQHFLGLEVKVKKKNKEGVSGEEVNKTGKENVEYDNCYLYNAGEFLADLYGRGSTSKFSNDKVQDWWLKAGDPIGLIIHEENPDLKLPKHTVHVESFSDHGIRLRFVYYNIRKNKFIKIWLIGTDPEMKTEYSRMFLRQLRINLLRVNAEKETLKNVLNAVTSKLVNIDEYSDLKTTLTTYLEFISSKLLTPVRFGIKQDKILDAAIASDNNANKGDFETLLAQLGPVENKYLKKNLTSLKNIFVLNEKVTEINLQTLVPMGVTEVNNNIINKNEINTVNITEKGDLLQKK